MTPIDSAKPRSLDSGSYHGLYRGIVAVRKDPDRQGRIKVKVRHVYGDIAYDLLPWAYPMSGGAWKDESGQYQGGGVGWVPTLESPVYVMFEGGNPLYPIWMGGWWGNSEAPFQMPVHAYGDDGEPNNMFLTGPSGATLQIDNRSGTEKILLRLPTGDYLSIGLDGMTAIRSEKHVRVMAPETIEIESDARVSIKAKNITVYSTGNTKVNAKGIVHVKATGNVNIDGSMVTINENMSEEATGDEVKIDTSSKQDGT